MRPLRAAALLDERGHSAHLEGAADFIEDVAVVIHDAAGGLGRSAAPEQDAAARASFETLGQGGHLNLLSELVVSAPPNLSEFAAVLSSAGSSGDLSENYRTTLR